MVNAYKNGSRGPKSLKMVKMGTIQTFYIRIYLFLIDISYKYGIFSHLKKRDEMVKKWDEMVKNGMKW